MDDTQQHWWFCLRHNTVEDDSGSCPGKDRLGPYATPEEAANALETVRQRNEEWEAADDE